MSIVVKSKNGKSVVLLNPAEKGAKFAKELKRGVKHTNEGHIKTDKDKKGIRLTKEERAYRAGYLSARQDNAKAFNSKKRR
ncbi:MAG: hypothetical protein IJW43_00030 [Clostridia bacterium]|nr:hypothetical protein [Clostridia bacterium]